jgi:hypothetical protein
LIAIALIGNAIFVWTTDTRLERQLAAIRAAGDPVRLADLARPAIPPEDNADTYLRRAEADIRAIDKETDNIALAAECPGFILPVKDQEKIKAAFASYPKVLPLVERAAACKDYNPGFDYALPPQEFLQRILEGDDEMGRFRGAARMLRRKALLLIVEGKQDEAVRTALPIFVLARHLDHNSLLMEYLLSLALRGMAIETANEALQTGPVSKEVRDALDAELAVQERMDGFPATLRCERAYAMSCSMSGSDAVPGRNFWFLLRGYWNIQESECLSVLVKAIALAGNPGSYPEAKRLTEEKGSPFLILKSLLLPGLHTAFEAVARVRADLRAMRVLNALQSHVPAGSSETPKLGELGLPAETTTDPFNGEPLHVKKTPQGWLVYSVGRNLRDDGGKVDDPNDGDVGVGPPKAAAVQPATKGGKK